MNQKNNEKFEAYLRSRNEISREGKKTIKEKLKRKNRRVLVVGIALVLFVLLICKYRDFLGELITQLFSWTGTESIVPHIDLLIPLGISFYTLQAIAYLVDIYRGKVKADRNPLKFLLYMSFFPQIIQGPIARHGQLAEQLYEGHKLEYNNLRFGAQLVVWGFIKKLVIAERIAIPANYIFEHNTEYTGLMLFLAVLLYGFQIYADFSGGIDIARGVAQMFGITLEHNFKQPYYASSVEDFWRRWHITMGSWMKDYIFYPLSLSKAFSRLSKKSRKVFGQYTGKRLPSFLSMFIVYLCVGFWHGPDWKYVVFGVWNGCFIMISILLEGIYSKTRSLCRINEQTFTWKMFRIVRTLVIVSFGRFFTGAKDIDTAVDMFKRTFVNTRDLSFITDGSLLKLGLSNANWILLIVTIVILLYVDYKHEHDFSIRKAIAQQHVVFRWAIYIVAIMVILIFGYYGPEYNPASFIYQQF